MAEHSKKFKIWAVTSPRIKGLFTALVALVVLSGIWWGVHSWYRDRLLNEARGNLLGQLDPYGNALLIDLRQRLALIYGLRAWVASNFSRADFGANFETFASQLAEGIAGVRNLTVAPSGVPQFVYPATGNEVLFGHDFLNDSRADVRADVARAIKSRKLVISGPYEMLIGGFGVIGRIAIYRNDQFWGLVTMAFDIPPILEESGITKAARLKMALRDSRQRVIFGDASVFKSDPVIHKIILPDGYWELAAIPINGWHDAILRDLRIFQGFALATVLLISTVIFLLAFRSARLAVRVLESTRELTTQLRRRSIIETELRAAEDRYKTLVELNPDAVIVNSNKKIVYANNAALRLFGAESLNELLGRSPFDFVDPNARAEVEQLYQRILATGQPNPPTIQPRRRLDGSRVYVEAVAAPLIWEGDKAVQVIMRDITEQRKAERSLRGLIETTQDAVISIDRQARIVMFNPGAEKIFGYRKAEVAGEKINMLMAEPYVSEHDGYIARYERTGEPRAIGRIRTVTARRKSGEIFPIELSVTQVATGEEVNYAAFIRDISEKVKLQNQAVESERLATIGTMAAKFGHELGNPLNGMSLTIQLLEQRLKRQSNSADEQTFSILTRLKGEISRLKLLLQDFRSLSRKETYNFQSTTLAALVSEAIEIELPRYAEQKIEVVSTFSTDLPKVTVDIDKMKQVILNLSKNAVEAMPSGGRLSFSGSVTNGTVTLSISDTGAGIPTAIDIFEPFFTTKSFGTGIGLTIVRQIVQAHGGSISYRSEPGKGTTFAIDLPLAR